MSLLDKARHRLANRRTLAFPAAFPWRWLFPVLMVGFAAAIPLLGKSGADAVLRSNSGTLVDRITDPAAPGYLAAVEQTPVGLVVTTDADDALVGATIVTAFADGGGYVITVPLPLGVTEPLAGPLSDVYADGGEEGVIEALEGLVDVDITTVYTFSPAFWNGLIELGVGELEVDLSVRAGTDYPAGLQTFDPDQVVEVLAYRSTDEDERSAAIRQQDIWRAYLDAAAAAPDPADVIGPLEGGIPEILRSLASGTVHDELLPATYARAIDLYVPEDGNQNGGEPAPDLISTLITRAVPFPQPPEPGGWPRLALLNGTGDLSLNEKVMSTVTPLGVQMNAVGNTLAFDVATTTIVYSDPEDAEIADTIADQLGTTPARYEAATPDVPGISDLADIIITLGSDYRPAVA